MEQLVAELTGLGCATPELDSEIVDPETGRALITAEALWPEGLQPGLGDPVVLELDAGSELSRLNELGYQIFTSIDALRQFVIRRNAQSAGTPLDVITPEPTFVG